MIVVVVEVTRKAYLASLVPVIVNAILNEHQVVADIVAFVSYGDFPRSRLGEKQRGKVLASWVTRKLRTIAQFSIREIEGGNFGPAPQHRVSKSSKAGSIMGHSARRSTLIPDDPPPRSPALATAPPLFESPAEPSLTTLVNSTAPTILEVPQISEPPTVAPPAPPAQAEIPYDSNGTPYLPNFEAPQAPPQGEAPQIQAPQVQGQGHRRDFSFDFGDFGQSTTAPSQQPGPAATETLSYRPGTGHQQPPNSSGTAGVEFPQRSDSYQARPSGPSDDTADWPQEALIYQSAFDTDGQGGRKDFL